MSYHTLQEIKRDRLPYKNSFDYWHRPHWCPEVSNSPLLNLKKVLPCTLVAACIVEPINHIASSFKVLNMVYELPKNSTQCSIYAREVLRTPFFFSELRKKLLFGAVQHTLDTGFKIACLHYTFGSTVSPKSFADFNSLKYLVMCLAASFMSGWTNYPLAVARKAYYADQSWPEELRKGYRSPLHALIKIPFTEGPLFLFRGGLPVYLGNAFGCGVLFTLYTWLKDKFKFLYVYHDFNYSFVKFFILSGSIAVSSIFWQPWLTIKDIMDNAPKQRGGNPIFSSSYEAVKYIKLRWNEYQPNLMHGYWRWFRQYGAISCISIWMADNLGLMDNIREDAWSWRVSYGYYSD